MPLRQQDTKIRKALKSKFNFFAKLRVLEPSRQEKDLSEGAQPYKLNKQHGKIFDMIIFQFRLKVFYRTEGDSFMKIHFVDPLNEANDAHINLSLDDFDMFYHDERINSDYLLLILNLPEAFLYVQNLLKQITALNNSNDDWLIRRIKHKIILLVQSNLNNKISLQTYFDNDKDFIDSYDKLTRYFSKKTGITMEEFRIMQEVEQVCFYMEETNLTMDEIAFKMNYSSSAYLSTQFKKINKISPRQHRKQWNEARKR